MEGPLKCQMATASLAPIWRLGRVLLRGIRAMDLLNLTIQGGKQMADKVASQPRAKSVRAANQAKENT